MVNNEEIYKVINIFPGDENDFDEFKEKLVAILKTIFKNKGV